jgi:hypothetical protein
MFKLLSKFLPLIIHEGVDLLMEIIAKKHAEKVAKKNQQNEQT